MKKTNNTETAQAPAGMPRKMYPDLAPEARADKMRDTADKVMDYQYHKPYTEEEIADRRKTLADLCIRISDLEGELAAQKALYKSLIQPEETAREGVVSDLRSGGKMVTEECFVYVDAAIQKAGVYNADGDLLDEKDITPDMAQQTIFQLLREGPDDQLPPDGEGDEDPEVTGLYADES